MSGWYFDYNQYRIGEIAQDIERIVSNNDEEFNFNQEVISKFTEAIKQLRIAEVYVERIDWLMCGDDVYDTFLERLEEDLKDVKYNIKKYDWYK
jgi:hypothetical protein